MAAQKINTASLANSLISEVQQGIYKPVYLLMGDEPYYTDLLCKTIIDNCIDESFKDFNETVLYGPDTDADYVISVAREFPMMAERRLVVVKDAQLMDGVDKLSVYLESPLDSTVLVLLFRKASADKRKALYKNAVKNGVVLESTPVRDYEIPNWIKDYYSQRGLSIEPDAAVLLGESTGTELSTIVAETEKLLKNLPEGRKNVTVEDIERNVGISRQYSIFELTKELSYKNAAKAYKIAAHLGSMARFSMPMAVASLYTHFNRILRYNAWLSSASRNPDEKARALAGVNPYFYKEYDQAVRNYSLRSSMNIVSLLCEYDYLGKGGDGAVIDPGELLMELVGKILNS